jgi:hypothetical protein
VGVVTLTGLKMPLSVEPKARDARYLASVTPHPGFDEGAEIELATAGGDVGAFKLRGRGIAALEEEGAAPTVASGQAALVTWRPGAAHPSVRVVITLDVSHHGNSRQWLTCDAPDTGSFEIPAALVTELLELGLGGYPTVTLSRETADSTTVAPGCVELKVASEVTRPVVIPGVMSCDVDEDCPGKRCLINRICGSP